MSYGHAYNNCNAYGSGEMPLSLTRNQYREFSPLVAVQAIPDLRSVAEKIPDDAKMGHNSGKELFMENLRVYCV